MMSQKTGCPFTALVRFGELQIVFDERKFGKRFSGEQLGQCFVSTDSGAFATHLNEEFHEKLQIDLPKGLLHSLFVQSLVR